MSANSGVSDLVATLRSQVRHAPAVRRLGRVAAVTGLVIESEGPNVGLGELCRLSSERDGFEVMAEVVGFRGERVLLMPLGDTAGLHPGCPVGLRPPATAGRRAGLAGPRARCPWPPL